MSYAMILDMFAHYNLRKGQCALLRSQIAELESRMIEDQRWRYLDAVWKPVVMDDSPHGNEVSRTTENAAVRLADGVPGRELREMQAEYLELCAKLRDTERETRCVEAWLQMMNDKQRFVVEAHLIQGVSWREMTVGYHRRFGEFVSKDTLKRLQRRALDQIAGILYP